MANGRDRVVGDPGERVLRGEGPGESEGGKIPPLEASACNPADHPIASGRGLANLRVDHDYVRWALVVTPEGYLGAVWTEGDNGDVGSQPFRWVHCRVPNCGAEIRNVKPARVAHIRMHIRAAAAWGEGAPQSEERERATQVEIARRARIDVSTVNKILNEIPGPVFRKSTIERVRRIAKKLGWAPHPRAKKIMGDVGRELAVAARAFLNLRPEIFPEVNGAQAVDALVRLEAAVAAAEQLWPSPGVTNASEGKAVGA